MSHPVDVREVLISLATAALVAAETDAAQTGQLIFRDEWKPTPRTRNPTTQPQSRHPNAGAQNHWLIPFLNHLVLSGALQPQQVQPSFPPPPINLPAPAPAPAPPPPRSAAAAPPSPAPPERPPQPQLQEDAVAKLLKDNDDVFDRLINHPFPRALGDGSASLDGFRYYMIQDTLYLETCARLKMAAVARSPNFKDVENFVPRHTSSLEYVKKSKETLISMLGVPETIIDTTPRSKHLDASEKYYMTSVREEDAFFAYYIVLLPCVLSYWRIAERLMDNPSTVRNAVYHPAWIEINYDRSSADKYTKFINANIMAKGGVDRWNHIFRIACLLEADLFNTGLQAPTPYQIVPNGTYSIQSSSAAERVVLDAGSSIVGINKTGGNNEKWHVIVTKDGYTFQNAGTGHYLGIATREEGRILQAVVEPYYWWINPVRSQPSKGSSLYQIYESGNLRYTLHADMEGFKSINRAGSNNFDHTPIITGENFEGSCQMWSFELEQLGRPDVLDPIDHFTPAPVQCPTQLDSTFENTFAITVPAGWVTTITSISCANCVNLIRVRRVVNGVLEKQEFVSGWHASDKEMMIDGSNSNTLALPSSEDAYVLIVEAYHSKNKARKDPRNLPEFKDLSTCLRVITTSLPNDRFPDFKTFTIFDESLDASGQGRTQNAIITIHASIKVTVDLNDPGKPDLCTVNDEYNEELNRPRPHYADQLPGLRFVYYRTYHKDGAIATKRPAYSNDAYLGRIRSKWVAPPHSVGSLKRCLSSMENIDPNKTTLFTTVSSHSPMADDKPISLKSYQTLGITPEEPLALLSEALPAEGMKTGTESLIVPPDRQSPPSPRFLYYGIYNEAGASASKAPIDPEEPWVSRINLDLIPPPISVTSLLRLLTMKEDITTSCQLSDQDGRTHLDNNVIFLDDGNWLGATADEHVVLKFTSRPQLTFTEGSRYEIQNCHTGYSLGLNRSIFRIEKPGIGYRDKPCTLKRQGDGGIAFRFLKYGTWAAPGFSVSRTEHSFCFIPSMTNKDSFFICEDPNSRKAFYDPGTNQSDFAFNLELKDLDPTETRQIWRLIPL